MRYTHLKVWTHGGNIWHSVWTPGTPDMSMSVLRPSEVNRIIRWAESHNMTIIDAR
jgi:hypothetical protein